MNIDEMVVYLLTPFAQVALIIGLAEVGKRLGLETRWIPTLDLVLGLISGVVIYGYSMEFGVIKGVVIGIALGLTACGLFSGLKNTVGVPSQPEELNEE